MAGDEQQTEQQAVEATSLTKNELGALNAATTLLDVAKANLEWALRPLREKYGLPGSFTYDRGTGEIDRSNGADG